MSRGTTQGESARGSLNELLALLDSVSPGSCQAMAQAWEASDRPALERAHRSLERTLEEHPALKDLVKESQQRILDWVSEVQPPPDKAGTLGRDFWERNHAAPAVADAVGALAAAEELDHDSAAILYRPWATAVGRPELPRPRAKQRASGR